jgi:hypothetical protein
MAFLEQHGFQYSGEMTEVNLLYSFADPIPDTMLPSGVQAHAVVAETDEISTRVAAQCEVWKQWYVGNVSGDDYATLI